MITKQQLQDAFHNSLELITDPNDIPPEEFHRFANYFNYKLDCIEDEIATSGPVEQDSSNEPELAGEPNSSDDEEKDL